MPLVLELVRPQSVVDVGCGSGTWLAEFARAGVADVMGVDSGNVSPEQLEIPVERFAVRDLSLGLELDRRFDLVVSLEVAEHLPPESAEVFVAALTALGPLVLFSAAIPHQGGVNHVNEQWPDYWAHLFAAHDHLPIDCLRRKIWDEEDVDWWYAQNLLLYAHRNELARRPELQREAALTGERPLALVHPRKYLDLIASWPDDA